MKQFSYLNLYLIFGFFNLCNACFSQVYNDRPSDFETKWPKKIGADSLKNYLVENAEQLMVANTFSASNSLSLPYRLFSPKKLPKAQKLPLLIHLHGRGERGTNNPAKLYNGLPLFMGENSVIGPDFQKQNPCYVLVPQCSDKTINEEWAKWVGNTPETPFEGLGKDGSYAMNILPSESTVATKELIDSLIKNLPIDKNRIYITGISMGGFGTWEFISRWPEMFAAAIPMAGFSDYRQVDKFKHLPIWIFHGGADTANPTEGSRTMYKLLKQAKADVHYTEYPDVAHSPAFRMAWSENGLLDWMFQFKKKKL